MVLEPLLDIYFDRCLDVLLTAGGIAMERQAKMPISEARGMLQATMTFPKRSRLSVMLVADINNGTPLLVEYSFQYMDADNATIFRYDNIGHHPGLPHAPHHKHEGARERIVGCPQPSVSLIRDEIEDYLKG